MCMCVSVGGWWYVCVCVCLGGGGMYVCVWEGGVCVCVCFCSAPAAPSRWPSSASRPHSKKLLNVCSMFPSLFSLSPHLISSFLSLFLPLPLHISSLPFSLSLSLFSLSSLFHPSHLSFIP